jgi:hypothetical protein
MGDKVRATSFGRAVRYGLRATGLAAIFAIAAYAQTAPQTTPQVSFAAASAHVGQPGSPVSIKLFRWSTDEERAPVVAALNPPPAPPPQPAAPAPAAEGATPDAERGGAARGGRAGRGGRGGRGRGEPAAPLSPIAVLTGALGKAPTIGYVWTDEVTGYSIKYAWHAPLPAGGERIVLATNRVLGGQSPQWKPAGNEPVTDYEFTVIELRVNAKGLGEGKTSLTTKIVVDNEAKTIALENYTAAPVILQNVKRS